MDFGDEDYDGYMVRYYDKNKRLIPYLLQVIRIGLGTQPAVNYNPLTMRILTEHFLNDRDEHKIFDGCMGWGGRMLGALASNRNVKYIGTDVNSNNRGCYERLGKFFNENCEGSNLYEIFYELLKKYIRIKSFKNTKVKYHYVSLTVFWLDIFIRY